MVIIITLILTPSTLGHYQLVTIYDGYIKKKVTLLAISAED